LPDLASQLVEEAWLASIFQSAMNAISVPFSPQQLSTEQAAPRATRPADAETFGAEGAVDEAAPVEAPVPQPGAPAPDAPAPPAPAAAATGEDVGATVPVYLSPKSLTFAGATTASGLIAGFVHNTMDIPVLAVSIWTGGIVGAVLIVLGFLSENRPRLTPYFLLSSLAVGAVNAALLVITIYGAISVAQPT
jgi:hypothetical protein